MDKIAIALAAIIGSFVWFVHLEHEVRKDYAKAGYIVIDKQAYRLTPVDTQTP